VWPISNWYEVLAKASADSDLPSVIFIEHASEIGKDEHPGENMQAGAAVVAQLINPLLQSSAWQSAVFIVSHDDPGGVYDHVPPYRLPAPDTTAPIASFTPTVPGDFTLSGLRLPLLVISPWVKPHFVSHVPREFTSILKLIEVRFGLPSLTARDASADDMTEFFDFTRSAWLTPPQLPLQPTNGICDWNREVSP
jgi:phospholipase C